MSVSKIVAAIMLSSVNGADVADWATLATDDNCTTCSSVGCTLVGGGSDAGKDKKVCVPYNMLAGGVDVSTEAGATLATAST